MLGNVLFLQGLLFYPLSYWVGAVLTNGMLQVDPVSLEPVRIPIDFGIATFLINGYGNVVVDDKFILVGGRNYLTGASIIAKLPAAPPWPAPISVDPPVVDFASVPTSGYIPLSAAFTDSSTGYIDSWSWNFGDGGTSTSQNPTHAFSVAGVYSVSLICTGAGGSTTTTKPAYITANALPPPPVADFSALPLSGNAPLLVSFTDLSTNTPTSWSWNFGDLGTSALQNPTHTYALAGTYTVSLVGTNAGGSDTETKPAYITASAGFTVSIGSNQTVMPAGSLSNYSSNHSLYIHNSTTKYVVLKRDNNAGLDQMYFSRWVSPVWATPTLLRSGFAFDHGTDLSMTSPVAGTIYVTYYAADVKQYFSKSTNSGGSWSHVQVGTNVTKPAVRMTNKIYTWNANTILISYFSNVGGDQFIKAAKSINAGVNWTVYNVEAIVASLTSDTVLSVYGANTCLIGKSDSVVAADNQNVSVNAGLNWGNTAVLPDITLSVWIYALSDTTWYAMYQNWTTKYHVFTKTTDAGATWSVPVNIVASGAGPQDAQMIVPDPSGHPECIIAMLKISTGNSLVLYTSSDTGATWALAGTVASNVGSRAYTATCAADPTTGGIVYSSFTTLVTYFNPLTITYP
jgi:PKD repeat protein